MDESPNISRLKQLREPFDEKQINKIPKAGIELDYVGHAHVTERLLEVDPLWNWEPAARDEFGSPILDRNKDGKPMGLWILLTICGVTRWGYGSVEAAKSEAVKELIGDGIRNAGMRFGIALDLWKKEPAGGRQSEPRKARQSQPAKSEPKTQNWRCEAKSPEGWPCVRPTAHPLDSKAHFFKKPDEDKGYDAEGVPASETPQLTPRAPGAGSSGSAPAISETLPLD